MNSPVVICDYGLIEASIIPVQWLGAPGGCPAGVYETILLQRGSLVRLPDHLARFERGFKFLGLDPAAWSNYFTSSSLLELVVVNGLMDVRSRIRIMAFTEPQPGRGELPGAVSFLGVIWPARVLPAADDFRCAISSFVRSATDDSYQHKLLGRGEVALDIAEASASGFQDVIYLNDRQEVCEAAYSNLWILTGDRLHTPPVTSPCLPGIVRKQVLQEAVALGLEVVDDQPATTDKIAEADRVFLTSSIRGIQLVSGIDGVWQQKAQHASQDILSRLVTSLDM